MVAPLLFFSSYFYLLNLLFLFNCLSYANKRILCAPRKFEIKAARNANRKIFHLNFASLPFMVAGKLFCARILFVGQLVLQLKELFLVFCLGDIMYFSCTFISLLWYKEAIFTLFPLLCESPDKFTSKSKFLASNNESILTYWSLCFISVIPPFLYS